MGQILFYNVPLLFLPMLVLYSHTDTNTDSFMKPCGNVEKKKKKNIYLLIMEHGFRPPYSRFKI